MVKYNGCFNGYGYKYMLPVSKLNATALYSGAGVLIYGNKCPYKVYIHNAVVRVFKGNTIVNTFVYGLHRLSVSLAKHYISNLLHYNSLRLGL